MANKKNLSAGGANALIALIMLAGIWCSAAAEAADWRPYAGDQNFSYFYDARLIDYPYKTVYNVLNLELSKLSIVSVWTKRIIRDNKGREWQIQEQKKLGYTTKGYERYEYTVAQKELNCSEKKYRVFSETDYGKDGDVLSSFKKDANYVEWKPIPPDSDTEALHHALCEKSKEKKAGQRDLQREAK
jgi:hypothetical protein